MSNFPVILRKQDTPEEGRRCLFIMKWGEPMIAMRIKDGFHTFTLDEVNMIRMHKFDNFMSGVQRWAYISDLEGMNAAWHC